ncbi:MAG: WbqC family protein [Candidatus Omnitrophica bacterium]|nr:WbqC family protein [Candidatus Omnitrophota bacterium]
MIISVHQPQYLPWLGFFDKIDRSDCFVFLDNVQYKKREFQNRNKIRTKDSWIWLTVPVITKGLYTQKINEVEIDNDLDWSNDHLKSIKFNYSRAQFFKVYFEFFQKLYSKKWQRLADLNVFIIKEMLLSLGIRKDIYFESELGIISEKSCRIIDICKRLNADTYFSGEGGRDYLDEKQFEKNSIKLVYQDFAHPEYGQCYGSFVSNMSIIDLLFNQGKNSLEILRGKLV